MLQEKTTMTEVKRPPPSKQTLPPEEVVKQNAMVQVCDLGSSADGEKRSERTAVILKTQHESNAGQFLPILEKLHIEENSWKVEKFLETSKQLDVEVDIEVTKEEPETQEPFLAVRKFQK